MEIWKSIPNYEKIYEASNFGRIRTHKYKTTYTEKHGIRKWKQRILKEKIGKHNSHRVSLWKNGKEKTWLVHRLVALTFIDNPLNKRTINHKDGNRHNNNIDNLEWATYKENNNHAFDNDLMTTNKKTILVDKDNFNVYNFRSLSKASLFIKKNVGYLSNLIIKGEHENNNWIWNF